MSYKKVRAECLLTEEEILKLNKPAILDAGDIASWLLDVAEAQLNKVLSHPKVLIKAEKEEGK